MSQPRKAVALISGGLDSMLAARVILDQGILVEGINFYTGYCVEGHTHAIRKKDKAKPKRNNALWSAEQLGIKLHILDIVEEYKEVLLNPQHGYGANMNVARCRPTALGDFPGSPRAAYRTLLGGEYAKVVPGIQAQRSDQVSAGLARVSTGHDPITPDTRHKQPQGAS